MPYLWRRIGLRWVFAVVGATAVIPFAFARVGEAARVSRSIHNQAAVIGFVYARMGEAQQAPEVASAPQNFSSRADIAGPDEPGERLVISGRVFAPDGETPVAEITVYAYHTDATGHYTKSGSIRPPRVQGWAKTDAEGRFEFHTIRPAAYPGRSIPAHVHFILWGAGYPRQWVDELRFEGDPFVTSRMLAEAASAGKFAAVRPLQRGADGALHCTVNFRVQRISNFKN
jgi:protocatechuate 3,4-dioxygenase beta subunit